MNKKLPTNMMRLLVPHCAAPLPQTLPLHVDKLAYAIPKRTLLNDVSFTVHAGSFTMILGPNGAGKTLLLRLCHGLVAPSSGDIHWNVLHPTAARRHHAMVFQTPVMLRRSVQANLEYPLAVRGMKRKKRREHVHDALHMAGLEHLARAPAPRLSGGEKQRLAMARAMITQPEVLLLDEPSTNLDPQSTRHIETLISQWHARGTTIIMTTHDMAQARRLAQRVLFLHQGTIMEDSPAIEFFDQPQTQAARAFLRGDLLL